MSNLFDETILKNHTIRNRFVMAPMQTYASNQDGKISEEEIEYFRLRAKEVGIAFTGCTPVRPNGIGFVNQFRGYADYYLDSLSAIASAMKENGAVAILQIYHAGRMPDIEVSENRDIVSASDIPAPRPGYKTPRPLEDKEIEEIIEGFYDTTVRAIKAGFDGVEVHGANTYLIQQFFSPNSNQRSDQWGGSREKRTLFPLRVIKRVFDAVSDMNAKDFIVGYRMSPEETEEVGITLDDSLYLCDKIVNAGVDYFHLSLNRSFDQNPMRDSTDSRVIGTEFANVINNRIPLIGARLINSEESAKKALEVGYSYLSLGKALLLNPDFVSRIQNGTRMDTEITYKQAIERKLPEKLLQKIDTVTSWKHMIKYE